MEKVKKIIIIILIILTILAIILGLMLIINKKQLQNSENDGEDGLPQDILVSDKKGIIPIRTESENIYYTVDDCVKRYLSMLDLQDKEVLLSFLDEEYIDNNQISNQNILNKIIKYKNHQLYRTENIYEISKGSYTSYFVKGTINNLNVYFEVGIYNPNGTFSIKEIEESQYLKQLSTEKKTNEIKENIINKKTYNIVSYKRFNDGETAKNYYDDYLKVMLTNQEKAYNMLDENYRKNKFGNYENFSKFINENKNKIETIYKVETIDAADYKDFKEYYNFVKKNEIFKITSYSLSRYDNYKQYTCLNGYKNYYIFKVIHPGEYTVILDGYTIDLPEFIQKYEKASNEEKVLMNIQKFFMALNDGDYRYAYNKLDETYKVNNFGTQTEFENYVKNNFFKQNKLAAGKVEKQGDVYLYNIIISDASGNNSNTVSKTFVMQLKEGTDFVMSFSK